MWRGSLRLVSHGKSSVREAPGHPQAPAGNREGHRILHLLGARPRSIRRRCHETNRRTVETANRRSRHQRPMGLGGCFQLRGRPDGHGTTHDGSLHRRRSLPGADGHTHPPHDRLQHPAGGRRLRRHRHPGTHRQRRLGERGLFHGIRLPLRTTPHPRHPRSGRVFHLSQLRPSQGVLSDLWRPRDDPMGNHLPAPAGRQRPRPRQIHHRRPDPPVRKTRPDPLPENRHTGGMDAPPARSSASANPADATSSPPPIFWRRTRLSTT
jgi:hypothetical protein